MFAIKRALRLAFEQGNLSCLRFSVTRKTSFGHVTDSVVAAAILVVVFMVGLAGETACAQGSPLGNSDAKLYFFTNDGCGPCLMVQPVIEALQKNGYPVQTVKEAQHPQFARQLGVDRTPTVVMIKNNRITHRHAGLIDGPDLQRWFAAVGIPRPPAFARSSTIRNTGVDSGLGSQRQSSDARPRPSEGTKVVIDRRVQPMGAAGEAITTFSSRTMHRGTARPSTDAENRALLATVKLRVEDPDGISYATGTVIHTHGTESLVMTCGHVFRDSKGQGRITAEYDFYGNRQTASGRLVDYDSDARDVGLVVIKTERPLPAVRLANKYTMVKSGLDVFSIGCDHGQDPTIRHTQIKNRAAYDGALKYDIFGRPVDGRSGGGLFTNKGELIGVCNSAAVQVDEGIYTALDTLHWQVATTGLSHLFESQGQSLAATDREPPQRRFAEVGQQNQNFATEINIARGGQTAELRQPAALRTMVPIPTRNPVSGNRPLNENDRSRYEVVIEVRSKRNPSLSEKIIIDDPTPELVQYLGRMKNQ